MILSICIPAYNRPKELKRLLDSISCINSSDIEIVICEDNSPKRDEIRFVVNNFKLSSPYDVVYIENSSNFGYDKNLRQCILHSSGEYITYMGDDDIIINGAIDRLINFIHTNYDDLGYILRSWVLRHKNGNLEEFKYFNESMNFDCGAETVCKLFRKSVFISGFTFRREFILNDLIDNFDGTLLFQLYILSEICMKHKSAYFYEPITMLIEEDSIPYFGSSDNERDLYTPGSITIQNSINFIKNFFLISKYIDNKYNCNLTDYLLVDMSKYSFPILSIQRDKGIKQFIVYCTYLENLGINKTIYYYIYKYSLVLFGKKCCESIIFMIKKILGNTPSL